jgi:hypothetical protein
MIFEKTEGTVHFLFSLSFLTIASKTTKKDGESICSELRRVCSVDILLDRDARRDILFVSRCFFEHNDGGFVR